MYWLMLGLVLAVALSFIWQKSISMEAYLQKWFGVPTMYIWQSRYDALHWLNENAQGDASVLVGSWNHPDVVTWQK